MKLTYRGASYNYEPPTIDMMEGEVGGKYRGQPWTVSYPRHIPVPQPALSLKYRGVAYQTGEVADAGVIASAAPVEKTPVWAVSPRNASHSVVSQVSEIHRANICQNLERRIEAAKARGDRQLLQMLEQESQQLTCSL
ncbi:DUF4278 domain-containing protein [Microcoleus sp. FACHB-672]|uniref:arginine synthesis PII-interacting regulator PirA n=1 Tax=Microcoleus sp. FACHB-672 TaxID=2692825 RepID=UPI001689787D|nr:DUF4278 domain-containing protein [Microcoleus sp. FACHB-672]MBD2042718.1 DUF4278 domain-containing protein [Microcoleus sp. FACHB-672]